MSSSGKQGNGEQHSVEKKGGRWGGGESLEVAGWIADGQGSCLTSQGVWTVLCGQWVGGMENGNLFIVGRIQVQCFSETG